MQWRRHRMICDPCLVSYWFSYSPRPSSRDLVVACFLYCGYGGFRLPLGGRQEPHSILSRFYSGYLKKIRCNELKQQNESSFFPSPNVQGEYILSEDFVTP